MNGWIGQLLFSAEQPLIWATSALSCLPASSFVASATQFFSLRSCYNAFDGLQMQPRTRVALWSRTTVRAAFTMRLATCSCNPVCQELRTCFAARTAPMRFANTCHTKSSNVSLSADDGDDSALLRKWRCFTMFICQTKLSPQSDAHFAELIFQKCSEHLMCTICRQLSQIEPRTAETKTLLRRPQEPHYPKNIGFRDRECFHP